METETAEDILEEMLCIIKGDKLKHASDDVEYLVNENGLINENAKEYLIKKIEALKNILPKCESKPKKSSLLGRLSSFKKKRVQLYFLETNEFNQMFGESLSSKLENQSIECQTVEKSCSLKEDVPLLLPCKVVSRSAIDIRAALKDFQWKNTYVVILIHLETKDAVQLLQSKETDEKELAKFKNVIFIDMAFNKDDKFQEGPLNKNAFSKIENFCSK